VIRCADGLANCHLDAYLSCPGVHGNECFGLKRWDKRTENNSTQTDSGHFAIGSTCSLFFAAAFLVFLAAAAGARIVAANLGF
jgi:hypothetical protein